MKIIAIAVAAAALGLFAGCGSTGNSAAEDKAAEKVPVIEPIGDRASAKTLAQQYIDAFAEAVKSGDYAKFEPVIPAASRKAINREAFNRTVEQYRKYLGLLQNTEFVSELEKPMVRDFVWKFTFEKKSEAPGHKDETVRREILYMVRVGQIDGKPVLVGSGVMNSR